MEKDLAIVLGELNKKISKNYSGIKKEKFENEIISLINTYKTLEIPEALNKNYESLMSEGKELLKESNIKQGIKVNYYLRYCEASVYDFKSNLKPLNTIIKSHMITSILFFLLAPQYFSIVLPLIFILPIFLGFRGMRKRMLSSLIMGATVAPMAILVAIVWIGNAVLAISAGTFNEFVSQMAQSYGSSFGFTQNLAIACIILSVVLLASSITLIYNAIKHRKMFI